MSIDSILSIGDFINANKEDLNEKSFLLDLSAEEYYHEFFIQRIKEEWKKFLIDMS